MFYLFLFVHIVVSMILILVVMLQSGKAGDLASAFGGATSQAAFGARGATTFLSKATTLCAVLFMLTSLGLSILFSQQSGSVMEGIPTAPIQSTPGAQTPAAEQAPVAPAETPPSAEQETPPEQN